MVHNNKLKNQLEVPLLGYREGGLRWKMQLKLCQGCELQHSKSFEREKLNPFHLPRLSIPEEGDNGKSEGEIAKCSESPGGLNVQQKTQVHFFWKKDFIL